MTAMANIAAACEPPLARSKAHAGASDAEAGVAPSTPLDSRPAPQAANAHRFIETLLRKPCGTRSTPECSKPRRGLSAEVESETR